MASQLQGNCPNALRFHTFQAIDDRWLLISIPHIGFAQNLGTSITALSTSCCQASEKLPEFSVTQVSLWSSWRINENGDIWLGLSSPGVLSVSCMCRDQTSPDQWAQSSFIYQSTRSALLWAVAKSNLDECGAQESSAWNLCCVPSIICNCDLLSLFCIWACVNSSLVFFLVHWLLL